MPLASLQFDQLMPGKGGITVPLTKDTLVYYVLHATLIAASTNVLVSALRA